MRMVLVAILAVVLSIGGFLFWRYLQSYQNTDDAEVDGYSDVQ
jgi:multidrug resistance efflux pump